MIESTRAPQIYDRCTRFARPRIAPSKMLPSVERHLLAISSRQIDGRLSPHSGSSTSASTAARSPGTLLKQPLKTDRGDVAAPGFRARLDPFALGRAAPRDHEVLPEKVIAASK